MNTTAVLSAENLSSSITIRIYDDAVAEGTEILKLGVQIDGGYTGDAVLHSTLQNHTLNLDDNDLSPDLAGSTVQTIFSDDFEGEVGHWTVDAGLPHSWTVGGQNTATDNAGMTGNCAFVRDGLGDYAYTNVGGDNTMIYTEIDASNVHTLSISFDWACEGEDGYDFGSLVYSTDGGSSFQTVPGALAYQLSASLSSATVSLPEAINNSTFHIGFAWEHDEYLGSSQPLSVDNVVIQGISDGAAPIASAVNTGMGAEAHFGPMSEVHFYDPNSGAVMLSLTNNSMHDFGCTTVEIDRAGTGHTASWQAGKDILDKSFKITPTNNMSGQDYSVTLYYTDAEIQGWLGNQASDGIESLIMVKTDGAIADGSNGVMELKSPLASSFGTDHAYTASFNSGFSGFSLGNLEGSGPLAVEVLDFSVEALQKSILLTWETKTETNNRGFEIERSEKPTGGFEKIGWIAGQGTTNALSHYQFEDNKAEAGIVYYYRLRQIDGSGKETLSALKQAQILAGLNTQISPNPVQDMLQVQLTASKALQGDMRIFDVLGKQVWKQHFQLESEMTVQIPTQDLTTGVYYLRIYANGAVVDVEKFIKN